MLLYTVLAVTLVYRALQGTYQLLTQRVNGVERLRELLTLIFGTLARVVTAVLLVTLTLPAVHLFMVLLKQYNLCQQPCYL